MLARFLVGASSPCAGDGNSHPLLHEHVSVEVIAAKPTILMAEIRDGRIERSQ